MANSENGWPGLPASEDMLNWVTVPGTSPPVKLNVQKGQPTQILRAFCADFNEFVEKLRDPDTSCYTRENSVWNSNHRSGTAVDLNFTDHPFHVVNAGFSPEKIRAMRDLMGFYTQDGLSLIYWGEDWGEQGIGPFDAMHVQLNGDTFNNPKTQKFIDEKIRPDGFSTYKRGAAPKVDTNAVDALSEVMGGSLSRDRYAALLPALSECLTQCGCTTVDRIAMWCAQIGHESGGLQWMQELADGSQYEGRTDLGNTQAGDGRRFKGHGPIQVTGRSNHTALSKWAFDKGYVPSADFFVSNPDELASDKYGFIGVTWYWTTQRDLNGASDRKDVNQATQMINGGFNGLDDRRSRYNRALGMGDRLLSLVGHSGQEVKMVAATSIAEKVLPYNHAQQSVAQEKNFDCCPASCQIVLDGRGIGMSEDDLIRAIGTTTDGTNTVEQALPILNQKTGGNYKAVWMPHDPPTGDEKEALWRNVKNSIDAGFGCILNFEVPSSNFPRGTRGSASPRYGGSKVWHYVACMGWADDGPGGRHLWIADPGFPPFDKGGYWMALDQVATAIPPHAYAFATVNAPAPPQPVPVVPPPAIQTPPSAPVAAPKPVSLTPGVLVPTGYNLPGESNPEEGILVEEFFTEWSAIMLGDVASIYRIVKSAAGEGTDTSPAFIKRARTVLSKVPKDALAKVLGDISLVEPQLLHTLTGNK